MDDDSSEERDRHEAVRQRVGVEFIKRDQLAYQRIGVTSSLTSKAKRHLRMLNVDWFWRNKK